MKTNRFLIFLFIFFILINITPKVFAEDLQRVYSDDANSLYYFIDKDTLRFYEENIPKASVMFIVKTPKDKKFSESAYRIEFSLDTDCYMVTDGFVKTTQQKTIKIPEEEIPDEGWQIIDKTSVIGIIFEYIKRYRFYYGKLF